MFASFIRNYTYGVDPAKDVAVAKIDGGLEVLARVEGTPKVEERYWSGTWEWYFNVYKRE